MNHWEDDAACATTDVSTFFDDVGTVHGLAGVRARHDRWRAKQICARCPVMRQCLNRALREGSMFGVFGGLDQHERSGWFNAIPKRFPDAQRKALVERLRYDGLTNEGIGNLLGISTFEVAKVFAIKSSPTGAAAIALREHTAWADVYDGTPPLAISETYEIPYERALDMCRLVDKQANYYGPKGYQRNAYRAQAV